MAATIAIWIKMFGISTDGMLFLQVGWMSYAGTRAHTLDLRHRRI